MTSFHAEKCCHLVIEHEASARRLCSSIDQFPISVIWNIRRPTCYIFTVLLVWTLWCTGSHIIDPHGCEFRCDRKRRWKTSRQTDCEEVDVVASNPESAVQIIVACNLHIFATLYCTEMSWVTLRGSNIAVQKRDSSQYLIAFVRIKEKRCLHEPISSNPQLSIGFSGFLSRYRKCIGKATLFT